MDLRIAHACASPLAAHRPAGFPAAGRQAFLPNWDSNAVLTHLAKF
jgi:hypothetical protein